MDRREFMNSISSFALLALPANILKKDNITQEVLRKKLRAHSNKNYLKYLEENGIVINSVRDNCTSLTKKEFIRSIENITYRFVKEYLISLKNEYPKFKFQFINERSRIISSGTKQLQITLEIQINKEEEKFYFELHI
jgi:hypothetical protein